MLQIETILCRAGHMDNYAYLLIDKETEISAIIDPSEPAPIIARCKELNVKPDYILNTHHHFDHTDGNLELKQLYQAKVVANEADKNRIPGFDIGVREGEIFMLGQSSAQIIDVSAHTQGHILWYFAKEKALFTGDTLFNLCIGGLFEGNTAQMFKALQKIKSLPDETLFYPGHEYTVHGAADAFHSDPQNPEIRKYLELADQKLKQGLPVAPVSLGFEKKCNPYLKASTQEEFEKLF